MVASMLHSLAIKISSNIVKKKLSRCIFAAPK